MPQQIERARHPIRVLILTQWFTPEPTLKGIEFAKELSRRGHSVQVVTGFPNYPGGNVYRGYRMRPIQRETMQGVSVIRLPLYPSHDRSTPRRIANYVSFALVAAIAAPLVTRRADVAYVYHPPATIGLPALSLRLLRRVPYVLDVQDLWPDTLEATNMVRSKTVLRLVGAWTRVVYRFASHVSVLSPGFKRKLVERHVPGSKISITYNWAPGAPVSEQSVAREVASMFADRFNVVFAGTMGPAQALHAVLHAAKLIEHELDNVQFVLVGSGVESTRLEEEAGAMNLSNVAFIPRMPLTEIGPILQMADVLLVHLRADPLFEITIPSKTQAYLAAGKPILMAVGGDAADLVERAQAGVRCSPEDPVAIANAVRELRNLSVDERAAMGKHGLAFYEDSLSFSVGVDRFESMLAALPRGGETLGGGGERVGNMWIRLVTRARAIGSQVLTRFGRP